MTRSASPRAAAAAAVVALVAFLTIPAAPAVAATGDGWVRLAHMSPDTAAVNVTLSSLNGDVVLFRLRNVGYGAVSGYVRLPQGTYALAMRPASGGADATPVVSGSVQVTAGQAETVAAIGLNKDIETKVISDDLDTTSGADARVRIVQASVTHDAVDVSAGSTTIVDRAGFGDVSSYATVPAGSTTVDLSAGTATSSAQERFTAGSAHTLFVIDDSAGKLTVAGALDSSASAVTPQGAVAAGGGGLADGDLGLAGGLAGATAVAGAGAALVLVVRRRRVAG